MMKGLAVYGYFKRNMKVFAISGVEENFDRFRGWRSLEDFKQTRGGNFGGRARARWRSMAR